MLASGAVKIVEVQTVLGIEVSNMTSSITDGKVRIVSFVTIIADQPNELWK